MAAAVLVWIAASPSAQAEGLQAEIEEWVIEPCMEVAAALDVEAFSQESIDLGFKREHIAEVMVASRAGQTAKAAEALATNAPWETRRLAYPIMLQVCLASLPGMK